GLPFFVEKPLDVDLERAKGTAARIAKAGLVTGVGYHWRHYDSVDWLQGVIAGQPIGMALGYWLGGTPGVWWWRKWESSGGQMVEQCTHITDLARWLMGEVTSVYAQYNLYRMDKLMDGLDVADAGTATLTFESGAVCQISTSCALTGYGLVGLDVHWGGMCAEIRGGSITVKGGGGEAFTNRNLINPTVREDQFFIDAVDGVGDPALIRSPYADALKTLAVTLAMNQSARTGEVVRL
ncbi:MAG: Gfo/Idh/MocA family oxidoreductase, partial [Armatimonadetes bacterium]|nr:Gfo/Idh/MocA family oxidoreductase [Armatimonadota bacterium]